jgi:hypothetical protein
MTDFRIASTGDTDADSAAAARRVLSHLRSELGGDPSFLMVAASAPHDLDVVSRELREAGVHAFHGFTSCNGCMTQRGVHAEDGVGMGMWAIRDPGGSFGTALVPMGDDPRESGRTAVREALAQAEREGEAPALILVNPTPGREEEVLEGIQDVVGPHVPVVGGSAADNEVAGGWMLFSGTEARNEGVMVSVLFPSVDVFYSFKSGYSPTGLTGVVTEADGRVLKTIDGEPAAIVYDRWTGGALEGVSAEGGNVLHLTSLHPIGRVVGSSMGFSQYQLSHPEAVTPDGSLSLFTDVKEGEVLHAMAGSLDSLVSRAGRVVETALERGGLGAADVSGALVTYCAGCMLTVGERMPEVAEQIGDVLHGAPFLGTFTFGEQGCFLGGENRHSNLMISGIVFAR